MGSLCNADGSKIMTEDDGYETIVPDLSAAGVTQADRDAAADFADWHEGFKTKNEVEQLGRAFARHRQQAIAQHEGGRGEPVAWGEFYDEKCVSATLVHGRFNTVPLYAHPPATRPAALAEDEVVNPISTCPPNTYVLFKFADGASRDDEFPGWAVGKLYSDADIHLTAGWAGCRAEDDPIGWVALSPRITQQAEEVARLREALKPYSNAPCTCSPHSGKCSSCVARAALNEQPGREEG